MFGLRNLHGDAGKGWKALLQSTPERENTSHRGLNLLKAVRLGFQVPSLGLAYLGGFVARASSIGITSFIPLLVNTYFISSGLCDKSERNPADVRETCRGAYGE